MQTIDIHVRGITKTRKPENQCVGIWIVLMKYKNMNDNTRYNLFKGTDTENTKSVRMIIKGILETVKQLKGPHIINLYTHTNYFKRSKEAIKNKDYTFNAVGNNQDLLDELENELQVGKHILNTVISSKYQYSLANYIDEHINEIIEE